MTQVLELMSTNLVTVDPSASIMEGVALMARHSIGSLLVMKEGALVGIFTERDVTRALTQERIDLGRVAPVSKWMTAHPLTIRPETKAKEALTLMVENGFRHLPVSDGQEVVGILSIRDVGDLVIEGLE